MGSPPDWFALLKAAQYLGCKPWELMEQPSGYLNAALVAMNAEAQAEKAKTKDR